MLIYLLDYLYVLYFVYFTEVEIIILHKDNISKRFMEQTTVGYISKIQSIRFNKYYEYLCNCLVRKYNDC
jgi:hypothetical protein